MSKRSKALNTERKQQEGRGEGRRENYKPWITIQDFPSSGRVTRIKGIKTNRQHEFLSDLERNYFYLLEFAESIIDIREQFPLLPLEETLLIAQELGIEHPTNPQTKEPIVMTTDFLITLQMPTGELKEVARTLKYKDELLKKRVIEKFELERIFFERQGIEWGIVTEQEIPIDMAQAIADLHAYYDISELEAFKALEKETLEDLLQAFISRCVAYKGTLRNLCMQFDQTMELERGSGIALLKHLIGHKILIAELKGKLDFNKHIELNLNIKKAEERSQIG